METSIKSASRFQLSAKTKEVIVDIAGYAFILLFLYTAINKIWKFFSFKFVMSVMPVVGPTFGSFIAYFIPTAEILISLLLIIPITRRLGLLASLILMSTFTVYLIFMVFYAKDLPCHCGGVLNKMSWNQHILFNIFFILLAGIGFKLDKQRYAKQDRNKIGN